MKRFQRTEQLLGQNFISYISEKTVTVCGLGGVGSAAALSLARLGLNLWPVLLGKHFANRIKAVIFRL